LDLPIDAVIERMVARTDARLLESDRVHGAQARTTILAAMPRLSFAMRGDAWTLEGALGHEEGSDGGLDRLARLLAQLSLAQPDDLANLDPALPHFQGGMIGYVGYDLAPRLERLPRRRPIDSALPDLAFGLHDTFVHIDLVDDTARVIAVDLLGEGPRAVADRASRFRAILECPPPAPRRPRLSPPVSRFTPDEYRVSVAQAREYIAAGDIFQVNLSQRFESVADDAIDPAWVHMSLRRRSPAPYSAFLRFDEGSIVSASPELFYRTDGRRVVTRPIKGTRPRGATPEADAAQAEALRASPKDRAELTMIVDLERNDLGRVCSYGSVRVTDPLRVESFPQVHHLVATVEGSLRPGAGPIDLLRAVFPGGSITGAPKIRAMEIIDELERNRRGVYTGAVGYFGRGGASQFNIAIRTVTIEGSYLRFQVGGGIVADSTPDAEYRETLDKARGIQLALAEAIFARQEGG
jgi:para-aminobenzoate synthetase component 1